MRRTTTDDVFGEQKDENGTWDSFKESNPGKISRSERKYDNWHKIIKVVMMLLVSSVVLVTGVVSKATTFFIVSQITASQRPVSLCDERLSLVLPESNENSTVTLAPRPGEKIAWLWAIFFSFAAPELLTLIRAVRTVINRGYVMPSLKDFMFVFVMESLHILGLAILFFIVLPEEDTVKGLVLSNGIAMLPGVLRMFMTPPLRCSKVVHWVTCTIAITAQVSCLATWMVVETYTRSTWALPLGSVLTSFGWWECYVEEDGAFRKLWNIKTSMTDGGARGVTNIILSTWKICLFLLCMTLICPWIGLTGDFGELFGTFRESFEENQWIIQWISGDLENSFVQTDILERSEKFTKSPALAILVQIFCSFVTYMAGIFACKFNIQRFSFALPLSLVIPVCISFAIPMCHFRNEEPCKYSAIFPQNLFYHCPENMDSSWTWLVDDFIFMWIPLYISHLWISIQIWFPKNKRLLDIPYMFGTDFYTGLMVDTSLMLNRRTDDGERSRQFQKRYISAQIFPDVVNKENNGRVRWSARENEDSDGIEKEDLVARIKGCATMWHETREEMREILKSLFRVDDDYHARRLALQLYDRDEDFYEWESHIFFDDAMSSSKEDPKKTVVNSFVETLIETVESLGQEWYGTRGLQIEMTKMVTPYGGRLEWTLPGTTKITCHLKDKKKIRHKKRWSQLMYFYYLLGHQLMEDSSLSRARKELRAENTFLLCLDGDVDFQPESVLKLLDLMRRNPRVAAATGRLHPTGTGYLYWFQKFEYAFGHWFLKPSEHVFGAVLCSPGCFSLVRAKAVMDDNVLKRLTQVPVKPEDYVLHNQGEDRWLCFLLLQQGWRVEFSAACDSFTACPVTFKEFYNQRRRWNPSTLFHNFNLIKDARKLIATNADISYAFIGYCIINFVGGILAPGSMLLVLVGVFEIAFGISSTASFILNAVPVGFFIIVCLTLEADKQTDVAKILSALYAVMMVISYGSFVVSMFLDGPLTLTAIGFLATFGSFFLAAALHPQEFGCVIHCFIYMLALPSMFILLNIYSLLNMNIVSWGTREAVTKSGDTAEKSQEKKADLKDYLKRIRENVSSCLGFNKVQDKMDIIKEINQLSVKLDKMEKDAEGDNDNTDSKEACTPSATVSEEKTPHNITIKDLNGELSGKERDQLKWSHEEGKMLPDATVLHLGKHEEHFWKGVIDKYLKPLQENKEQKTQAEKGLKEMRDSISLGIILINIIWIAIVYVFQANAEAFAMVWPLGAEGPNITFNANYPAESNVVHMVYEYDLLEPVGIVFIGLFLFMTGIMMIGLLIHRVFTLGHIVSSTSLIDKKDPLKDCVDIIKDVQHNLKPDQSNKTLEEKTIDQIRNISEDSVRQRDARPQLSRRDTVKALQAGAQRSGIQRTLSI